MYFWGNYLDKIALNAGLYYFLTKYAADLRQKLNNSCKKLVTKKKIFGESLLEE